METQMSIPFALDATGKIASQRDPDRQLGNRLYALIATQPGMRVMRAGLGVASARLLFNVDAGVARASLGIMVNEAVTRYEPSAKIIELIPDPRNDDYGYAAIQLTYTRATSALAPTTQKSYTIDVAVGGTVQEIT